MSYFAIVREQLAQAVTVDSHETSGLRQKENMKFTEIEDWKKANPGKATPAASVEKVPVLQKDGSTQIKEGCGSLWTLPVFTCSSVTTTAV